MGRREGKQRKEGKKERRKEGKKRSQVRVLVATMKYVSGLWIESIDESRKSAKKKKLNISWECQGIQRQPTEKKGGVGKHGANRSARRGRIWNRDWRVMDGDRRRGGNKSNNIELVKKKRKNA